MAAADAAAAVDGQRARLHCSARQVRIEAIIACGHNRLGCDNVVDLVPLMLKCSKQNLQRASSSARFPCNI